jgi:hypothetical protein
MRTPPNERPLHLMKQSRMFILPASFILGLLAVCWSRAQTPSHPLKVIVNGVEVHTLMSDQHNALVGHLEAAGQTNALELLRQYRCAYSADLSSSELGDTVAVLQNLREGQTDQAIQRLEQRLSAYANLMCNSYGCLSPTNRARVSLESLERARDYFGKFPPPTWGAEMEKAVDEVLRLSSDKPKK